MGKADVKLSHINFNFEINLLALNDIDKHREKQLASTELVRIMHDQFNFSKLWTSG